MQNTKQRTSQSQPRRYARSLAIFLQNCQDFSYATLYAESERLARLWHLDGATIFSTLQLEVREIRPFENPERLKQQLRRIARNMAIDALRKRIRSQGLAFNLDAGDEGAASVAHSAAVQLQRRTEEDALIHLKWAQVERCLTRDRSRFPLLNRCRAHFERTGRRLGQEDLSRQTGQDQSTVSRHLQAERRELIKALAAPEIVGMDL